MDNSNLRAAVIRAYDDLSENDRERLNFFLSRDNSILNVDSDIINKKDIICLINLFKEFNCNEGVKLLKEYINANQSTMSPVNTPVDEKHCRDSNNTLIHSNNININPVTIVLDGNRSKRKGFFKISSISTQKCLLLFIILLIVLTAFVIINSIRITRLKIDYDKIVNNQTKKFELKPSETVQQLENKRARYHHQSNFIEGKTCGCTKWCNERSSPYGVCGDGHRCICRAKPIEKDSIGDACTCDSWCRIRGYKDGGICGDGYTCICSK